METLVYQTIWKRSIFIAFKIDFIRKKSHCTYNDLELNHVLMTNIIDKMPMILVIITATAPAADGLLKRSQTHGQSHRAWHVPVLLSICKGFRHVPVANKVKSSISSSLEIWWQAADTEIEKIQNLSKVCLLKSIMTYPYLVDCEQNFHRCATGRIATPASPRMFDLFQV